MQNKNAIKLPNGTLRVVNDDDSIEYTFGRGLLHREDGPALELSDGSTFWYSAGRLHRKNGPAVERANGSKEWLVIGYRVSNGKWCCCENVSELRGGLISASIRHREDGPALINADGSERYFINGEELTKEEFESRRASL